MTPAEQKREKLKVWGGLTMSRNGQLRTIVAARSQSEAAALLGMSLYEFREYWSETGNAGELKAALANPRTVLRASSSMGHDFTAHQDTSR